MAKRGKRRPIYRLFGLFVGIAVFGCGVLIESSLYQKAAGITPVSKKPSKPVALDTAPSTKPANHPQTTTKPQTTPTATASSPTSAVVSVKPSDITQVNEQFSGSSLDTSLWQAMTRPRAYRNGEEQDYSPSQVSVNNGALQITASRDTNGNWHSGEVDSKWNYTYGEFEVRLALSATGPGIWPAAWMMGTTGTWPSGGEIDMFENINGDSHSYGTIHGAGANGGWQLQQAASGIDVTQYHTYKLIKQPNFISWWVDGVKQAEWTPSEVTSGGIWPFETHTNMGILNVAVGGSWPGPSSPTTPNSVTMYVDYFTVKNAF